MKMRRVRNRKHGFTLLEMTAATAILATMMTASMVLIRTSYSVWEGHERDLSQTESVCAVVRHLMREIRQAQSVTAISTSDNPLGGLSLLMPNASTHVWETNDSGQVLFGVATADSLLAESIEELSFIGYKADGVTPTTNAEEIHLIECRAKTVLEHGAGEDFVISAKAWVQSW